DLVDDLHQLSMSDGDRQPVWSVYRPNWLTISIRHRQLMEIVNQFGQCTDLVDDLHQLSMSDEDRQPVWSVYRP
ncbi:hypothetical protein PS008_25400, partial [Shigella sonnei]|nr:hypothetical protein [Shigella sonnei]